MKNLHKSTHQPFYYRKKVLLTNHFYDILIFLKRRKKNTFRRTHLIGYKNWFSLENFIKFLLIENHSFYFCFLVFGPRAPKTVENSSMLKISHFHLYSVLYNVARKAFRRCGHANHYIFRDQLIHSDAMREWHLKKKKPFVVNERMQLS